MNFTLILWYKKYGLAHELSFFMKFILAFELLRLPEEVWWQRNLLPKNFRSFHYCRTYPLSVCCSGYDTFDPMIWKYGNFLIVIIRVNVFFSFSFINKWLQEKGCKNLNLWHMGHSVAFADFFAHLNSFLISDEQFSHHSDASGFSQVVAHFWRSWIDLFSSEALDVLLRDQSVHELCPSRCSE